MTDKAKAVIEAWTLVLDDYVKGEDGDFICGERHYEADYTCTRPKEHFGRHVAHAPDARYPGGAQALGHWSNDDDYIDLGN